MALRVDAAHAMRSISMPMEKGQLRRLAIESRMAMARQRNNATIKEVSFPTDYCNDFVCDSSPQIEQASWHDDGAALAIADDFADADNTGISEGSD